MGYRQARDIITTRTIIGDSEAVEGSIETAGDISLTGIRHGNRKLP